MGTRDLPLSTLHTHLPEHSCPSCPFHPHLSFLLQANELDWMTAQVCPVKSSVYLRSQILELTFRNSEKNETPDNKVHLNNI